MQKICKRDKYFSSFSFHFTAPLLAAYRGIFKTWSNIYNGAFFAEILNSLGSLKMVLWEISQNSQEKIYVGISFIDKVELCRSAASLKTIVFNEAADLQTSSAGVFLWILQNS